MKDSLLSSQERHYSSSSSAHFVDTKEKTLDEVLEMITIGKFHYRLLAICGMAFMVSVQILRF
jgi:hypothetical protein